MIVNLVTFKVVSELDDVFGQFYFKLVVMVTDDGVEIKDPFDYEMDTKDLIAVAYWCYLYIFLVFSKNFFNMLSIVYPN
jgi:hypothetical protein